MMRMNRGDDRGGSSGEDDGVTGSVDISNVIMTGTGKGGDLLGKRESKMKPIFLQRS